MTRLRLDQLPAKVRAQLEESGAAPARKSKTSRTVEGVGLPLTCRTCGAVIDKPSESALSRHAATHDGLVRFEHRPAQGAGG